jgi:hypothetical protein
MITFLLLFCFILIAIAFLLIIVLYQKFSTIKDLEKKQSSIIHEMEQTITVYLMEMKEENEVFLNKLRHYEQNSDSLKDIGKSNPSHTDSEKRTGSKDTFEVVESTLSKQDVENLLPKYNVEGSIEKQVQFHSSTNSTILKQHDEKENSEPTLKVKDDLYVQSLSAQALLLQKQGDTIEQIAKKLGKGKTEIELLLKFRQN